MCKPISIASTRGRKCSINTNEQEFVHLWFLYCSIGFPEWYSLCGWYDYISLPSVVLFLFKQYSSLSHKWRVFGRGTPILHFTYIWKEDIYFAQLSYWYPSSIMPPFTLSCYIYILVQSLVGRSLCSFTWAQFLSWMPKFQSIFSLIPFYVEWLHHDLCSDATTIFSVARSFGKVVRHIAIV